MTYECKPTLRVTASHVADGDMLYDIAIFYRDGSG